MLGPVCQVADTDTPLIARQKASTRWLGHTHALSGPVALPLQLVQQNLGHKTPATTSLYITNEERDRVLTMQGFWERSVATPEPEEPE